ncbi:MAG: ankyrin repeat domain-containing protein [Bacteroidota bacterium]
MRKKVLIVATLCLSVATATFAVETSKTVENTGNEMVSNLELSSFCKAIMQGDIETVKKLIDLGEDVNKKSLGMAPVHFAARYNKPEILELLIANGADLKKRCDKGYTAKKHAELSNATASLEVIETAMKK